MIRWKNVDKLPTPYYSWVLVVKLCMPNCNLNPLTPTVVIMGIAIKHPVCQSARMSKITNVCLTRSDTGCFIAVPIWQQWASKDERFAQVATLFYRAVSVCMGNWKSHGCYTHASAVACMRYTLWVCENVVRYVLHNARFSYGRQTLTRTTTTTF